MSPNTFRASPASSPMFPCRCPMAFSPSSAEDPTESSRGLLGHFSFTQMGYIESLFVSMGEPDPWGSIINPIWAAHLVDVEEAWDRAPESSPDLISGETPQWGVSLEGEDTQAPHERRASRGPTP